jgi:hypothetical protein
MRRCIASGLCLIAGDGEHSTIRPRHYGSHRHFPPQRRRARRLQGQDHRCVGSAGHKVFLLLFLQKKKNLLFSNKRSKKLLSGVGLPGLGARQ